MLAHYLQYIDGVHRPAVLWTKRDGFAYPNPYAAALLTSDVLALELSRRAESAWRDRRGVELELDTSPWICAPMFANQTQVTHVLCCAGTLAELPHVLYMVHNNSRHFSQIVHNLPHIILTARPSGKIDYASRRWFETTGASKFLVDMHAGFVDHIDRRDAARFSELWRAGIATRRAFAFELRLATARGPRWHSLHSSPTREDEIISKWNVSVADIDEDVAVRLALERTRARLDALAGVGRLLGDVTMSEADLARIISSTVASTMAVDCSVRIGGHVISSSFSGEEFGQFVPSSLDEVANDQSARAFWLANERGEMRAALAARAANRSGDAVQLIVIAHDSNAFGDDDFTFAGEMATRLQSAIDSAAAYRREHTVAQTLQRSMLPVALPRVAGISFDVAYRVADDAALVGGDWYDAFETPGGAIAIALGDVAGHGLEAAIVMGHVREAIRLAALEGRPPHLVLASANRTVLAGRSDLVTAFFGLLDPLTLEFAYANAGHPPPFVIMSRGESEQLPAGGVPLGVREFASYDSRTISLDRTTGLALYTDGLTELERNVSEGERGLAAILEAWAASGFHHTATEIVERSLGARSPRDDIALLLVTLPASPHIEFQIRSNVNDARRARLAIARFFDSRIADGEKRFGFIIAVGEAINNAVEHARRTESDIVSISATASLEGVHVVITDRGRWRPAQQTIERGRGLQLMRALSDDVDVRTDERGTTIQLFLRS